MRKVLVVDDDKDLLDMVELALIKQGFKVHTIGEGKVFFDTIEAFKPDVILLDIFLNDADGRELCYQLKSESPYKHIPVALYSAGHISHSSIHESKANIFISKPFDIHQLGEKIGELLSIRAFPFTFCINQKFFKEFTIHKLFNYPVFQRPNLSAEIVID